MRRSAVLATAVATTLVLASPVLSTASAAGGHAAAAADQAAHQHGHHHKSKLKLKPSAPGIEPGQAGLTVTAKVGKQRGKVTFTLSGNGVSEKAKVKVHKHKAVYAVPLLGTGDYKVKAKFKGSKGKTKFEVYNSNVTTNATSFTFSKKQDEAYYTHLTGSVLYKGSPATGGDVDIYKDGNFAGGSSSPNYLGFVPVYSDGTFDFSYAFGEQIAKGKGLGGNLGNLPPGTYSFQIFYTPGIDFSDYVSSQVITVTVTP